MTTASRGHRDSIIPPKKAGGAEDDKQNLDVVALNALLERLAPGAPLRTALERIILNGTGGLIVLGTGPEVDALCTGGFTLDDATFSSARVAELAKMDGAIVLDDDWQQIIRANVHLVPDSTMPTNETGSRHRTAERVALQTAKPVVSVSEERSTATLYQGRMKHQLRDPTEIIVEVNQSLITLERFRRRLDESEERLTRLELSDLVTYRPVVLVLHRAELVLRIGERIEQETVGLGEEGQLISLQLADLVQGVERLRNRVLKDYVRPVKKARVAAALEALQAIPAELLMQPERVATALGFDQPDAHVRPLGVRLLSRVPRLPARVRDSVASHFGDLQSMLEASVEELDKVEGIGSARAGELRKFFDRTLESLRFWSTYDVW